MIVATTTMHVVEPPKERIEWTIFGITAIKFPIHLGSLFFYNCYEFNVICGVGDDHYLVFRLDIGQDSEFATGYGYLKRVFKRERDTRSGYPKRFYRYLEDSDFWKKLYIAQSLIYYLQKHIFSLLCHDFESVKGVTSAL